MKWSAPTVGLQLKAKHQQHGELDILLIAATAAQLHLVTNYLIKTNLKMGLNAYRMLLGYTDMIYYQRDDKKTGGNNK